MTQALEVVSPTASRLARVTGFTDQQIALISQTVAPGAGRVELAWFLYNAGRLELEPTLDQIYLIKYDKDKVGEIVIGINGYRAMADSSGCYAGSDRPVYEYDQVGQPAGAPSEATVTVWKIVQGQRVPFTASARWDEFYPGDGKIGEQYRKRPHNQLAIRAESHALRKGFPYQMRRLDSRADLPAEWREAAEADIAARNDPAVVALNAKRYDDIFDDAKDQKAIAKQTARAHTKTTNGEPARIQPQPERDPELQDALIDNEHLVRDAEDIGVPGSLKRFKADPSTWSLSDILAANDELRTRITSHQEL